MRGHDVHGHRLYLAEWGIVSIYKLADIHLNAAAGGGTVVGDFCIVRVIGRCPSTRSSPPLSNDTAHGGLLRGVYQYTAIQGALLTCPSSTRRRDAAAHGSLLPGVRRDTTVQGAHLGASFIDPTSSLTAAFYVVSVDTSPYMAPALAHF